MVYIRELIYQFPYIIEGENSVASKEKNKEIKNIKLTITMLVSNRIDTIKKCMDSINPILKNVPSELIVVDTGSTDGSIDIVKEYTSKIVPFTWCNDFAKARNAGLKDAQGEWIMFLDDDEWFEDVSEIIEFFNSDEYTKYKRGVYIVRNYGDPEGNAWSESNAARMVKKDPETAFQGTIHEYLGPQYHPTKYFTAYVHHYGYVFASHEERKKHSRRNISLLEEELKRNPNDIRLLTQAIQEYFGTGEMAKVLELSCKVLDLYKETHQSPIYVGYCYNFSLRAYIGMDDWDMAYNWGTKILNDGAPTSVSFMGTIREMVKVCLKLKKYADGLNCLNKFFELYDELNGKVNQEEICLDLSRYFQSKEYELACLEGIALSVPVENWDMAEKYFQKKNWELEPLLFYADSLDYIMKLWAKQEFCQEYVDSLDNILKHEKYYQQIINNMKKYSEENKEEYIKLLKIFASCSSNVFFAEKYRFIYYALYGAGDIYFDFEKSIKKLWEETTNPLLWDSEMWNAIEMQQVAIDKAIEQTPYLYWFAKVNEWLEHGLRNSIDAERSLSFLCEIVENNIYIKYLKLKYEELKIRKKILQKEAKIDKLNVFLIYSIKALEFYSLIYKKEMFTYEYASLLPPDGAFAVYIGQACVEKSQGNYRQYLRCLTKAAKSYPCMKEWCKDLIREV